MQLQQALKIFTLQSDDEYTLYTHFCSWLLAFANI